MNGMNWGDLMSANKPQQKNNNELSITFKGDLGTEAMKFMNGSIVPQRAQAGPVQNNMGAGITVPSLANNGNPTSTALLGGTPTMTGTQNQGALTALAALASGASLLGGNNQSQQRFAPAINGGGGFSGKLVNPYSRR